MTAAKDFKRRKRRLLEIQNGLCYICQGGLTFETATMDHIIPKSKGGANNLSNLAVACKKCNLEKGNSLFIGRPV